MDVKALEKSVRDTAERILLLEDVLEYHRATTQKTLNDIEQSRTALADLVFDLEKTLPSQKLPNCFSLNGIVIDLTDSPHSLDVIQAPNFSDLK